ncbi:hypothetical protein NDU88_006097 [Pleurodeles waltl]|uniref:Uncharacterized protein n=1 Tax=Pleurodeles waltl TaxID=8319 RepID=A0AAV7NPS5_PLEWA|nr:hypothetical protein NDU88_006097 [Pleurodeles waltl]
MVFPCDVVDRQYHPILQPARDHAASAPQIALMRSRGALQIQPHAKKQEQSLGCAPRQPHGVVIVNKPPRGQYISSSLKVPRSKFHTTVLTGPQLGYKHFTGQPSHHSRVRSSTMQAAPLFVQELQADPEFVTRSRSLPCTRMNR